MFNYRILSTNERVNSEWNYIEISRKLEITYDGETQTRSLMTLIINIEDTLFAAIADIGFRINDSDMVKIMIKNDYLTHDIWISFRKGSELTRNVITNAIFKVCQSKIDFLIEGLLTVEIVVIKMPSGGGHKRKYGETDLATYEKRSSKTIMIARDGLCCARSLVVGKAIASKLGGIEWRRLKDDVCDIQLLEAKKLCEQACVTPYQNCGVEELDKFQDILDEYRIIVTDAKTSRIIYKGPDKLNSIYLLYTDNHYFPTRSLKAFLGFEYFCEKCLKGYRERSNHKCINTCKSCFCTPACISQEIIDCNSCGRAFSGEVCMNNHIKNKICDSLKRCEICKHTYKSRRRHLCGKFFCNVCRELVETKNHFCYVSKPNLDKIHKEDNGYKLIIYYDIESSVSESGIHLPNLVCASYCCSLCTNSEENICKVCEKIDKVFEGRNCIEDFCKWIFNEVRKKININVKKIDSTNPKIFVVAHNGKAYDFHFILQYLNDNHIAGTPCVIKSGSKILTMSFLNVKFLDSVSFLPMPLKALPKAFGIVEQKGWFPHRFNVQNNWDYVGSYPAIEYYDADCMSKKDRNEFLLWYENVKTSEFNFRYELIRYCAQDVLILKKSFEKFRQSFREQTNLDPISRCITIAQACMEVFKTFYLKNKTIAVIPSLGYEPRRKSSVIANFWIDWISNNKKITIVREKKLGKYYVDGFHAESQTVYEFLGCFFHGCLKCFPNDRDSINTKWLDKSMDFLHCNTINKLEDLRKSGYKLEIIWECEFKAREMKDKEMMKLYDRYLQDKMKKKPPLDPRDAFFGGRTNAIKLFHEVVSDEKIRYYDFTSLYPYVVKYCSFPIGHPDIIRFDIDNEVTDISKYQGFVLCEVIAPRNLYIPVLPVKIDNKLMFPLCVKCAKMKSQVDCNHSDTERAFIGTWTTPELNKALEKSYKILKVFEVWNFPTFCTYDKKTKKDGLFSEFMDKWLKLKVEASGYPSNVITETEKDSYILSYEAKEGIKLDRDNIKKNPSLRTQAKLMANSFWGKFAQRPNLTQVKYLDQPNEFFKLLTDQTKIVLDAFLVNNSTMMVQFEDADGFVRDPKHSNVVIAAFTTAYARLKLYEVLERLDKNLLYFDTDSVIFVEKENANYKLTLGDYLGELTDELSEYGKEAYITKFVSGGPKNYAYEVRVLENDSLQYCCKIKGITLNYKTREKLNFDTIEKLIKDSVKNGPVDKIFVDQLVFKSTKDNIVMSNEYEKAYRLVYDKRRINEVDYSTLPFGYSST